MAFIFCVYAELENVSHFFFCAFWKRNSSICFVQISTRVATAVNEFSRWTSDVNMRYIEFG